ncbi:mitochondrial glyco protein [Choiromyces venosus 120613-1]|uniref:Mitochondrial glyco protein n=1 Tax=Choiromyces venosus 120613-1 TaxID=1336337 RepID=A0A3N4JKS7_9PEZI|nr:mitochondrial glyco protein [Choiromyces venosus 120613-1]
MFSARAASRFLRAPSVRSFVSRSISTARPQASFLRPALIVQRPRLAAQFSTTFSPFEKLGQVDEELALKLQTEIELEKSKEYEAEYPLSVREYLETGQFEIFDKPGQEEVQLVRKFGDETIRVEFSISDLNALSNEGLTNEDLYDEQPREDDDPNALSSQSGGAQSKAAKDEGRAQAANDMDGDGYDDEPEPGFPARVNVTIEKPNSGALQIEAIAQDGMIVIDNVFYHKSAKLATAQTAEADWERRGIYAGPPFGNLDEDLQVLLERYLDERGINTALALFVPDYIDYKEQREYVQWLENVHSFVAK